MRKLHPVKASEWNKLSEANKILLSKCGAVPIIDVFFPLWGNVNTVNLLFGGYGSGKSVFIAQELIRCCLESSYFKCYYGRKVKDDVRGSVFDTICSVIEDLDLKAYFTYSRADNSTMVIRCKNGNVFIPFGGSSPDQLKSIKDPTHFWCEEFDQFDDAEGDKQGDFQLLFPRLRTSKALCQFYGSFNTAPVFENHWILKYFFPDLYKGEERVASDVLADVRLCKTFANYTDNPFIDQKDYLMKLKLAAGGSDNILRAIADGAWGVVDNKNPWLYNFNDIHIKNTISFLPSFPVYLSFDFNNEPFACTAWQMSPQKGLKSSFIHCIKEFTGFFKVEDMCQRIKTTYPFSILHVTGDRNGQNKDIGRNKTLYEIIGALLNINDKLMDLNSYNLEHSDSRVLCNMMLYHYENLFFSKEGCPNLIGQCRLSKVDIKNAKPHHLLKDRGLYKMDEFDSMRYFFQTYFNDYIKNQYINTKPQKLAS